MIKFEREVFDIMPNQTSMSFQLIGAKLPTNKDVFFRSENCNIKLSMFSVRTNLCYMIYLDFDRIAADLKLMQSAAFS